MKIEFDDFDGQKNQLLAAALADFGQQLFLAQVVVFFVLIEFHMKQDAADAEGVVTVVDVLVYELLDLFMVVEMPADVLQHRHIEITVEEGLGVFEYFFHLRQALEVEYSHVTYFGLVEEHGHELGQLEVLGPPFEVLGHIHYGLVEEHHDIPESFLAQAELDPHDQVLHFEHELLGQAGI